MRLCLGTTVLKVIANALMLTCSHCDVEELHTKLSESVFWERSVPDFVPIHSVVAKI